MASLIKSFLNPDPSKRLGSNSVNEVKNHAFFSEVDWAKVGRYRPPFLPPKQKNEAYKSGEDMASYVSKKYGDSILSLNIKFSGRCHKADQFGS